jgi:hypothetical protein
MNRQFAGNRYATSLADLPETEREQVLSGSVLKFIQVSLGSVWAMELMLTLMSRPERVWTAMELVREMRASESLIRALLKRFRRLGLAEAQGDIWYWRPATDELEALSWRAAEAHIVTPFAVLNAIAQMPASSGGPGEDAADPS